jgi:biopolymer transport protein ExbD
MAKFKKKLSGKTPAIPTASLPDIVFMLLFFFMVTTHIRNVGLKVRTNLPEANETQKLEKKSLISYIYIGPPTYTLATSYGNSSRIQLNDAFAEISDIVDFIKKEKESRSNAEVAQLITSLKVDKKTKMGIVSDVEQELRKAEAYTISYSTSKKPK